MKKRFLQLGKDLGAYNWKNEYILLEKHYSSKNRYYHNLNHIKRMLLEFDSIKHLAKNPLTLELAVWYHDIIYNARRYDNEEKSVIFLKDVGDRCKVNGKYIDAACKLIMETKHISSPKTMDGKIIADCDLTSFGKPYKAFSKFSRDVWKEYTHYGKELFAKKRIEALQRFLDKKPLYYTEYFRKKYELKARNNLNKAIIVLKKEL